MLLDHNSIRSQFPVLQRQIKGRPIIYLDSAATYLKPQAVIDAVTNCYLQCAGTIGRGVHVLAEEASQRFDEARTTIANFINADADEIIFVRNATEAINLVAASLDSAVPILGSVGEHHSNLLPWRRHQRLVNMELLADGHLDLELAQQQIQHMESGLVAVSTISNALGNRHPVERIVELAHSRNCDLLLDASQSIAHEPIDVRQLDCEYLCFSGHKLGGPTGVGVLYAKRDRLERLQPQMDGGGMVESVELNEHVLADLPMRLEAGTPSFEAVLGLAAACDWFAELGLENVALHERRLVKQLVDSLSKIPRITVRGPDQLSERGSIVAFHVEGLEAHGAARLLSNRANLCLRSGYHCAQPAHLSLGLRPTLRASLGVYNNESDIHALVATLSEITSNL